MNLLKKTALSIGAAATVIAPLATVVSCGSTTQNEKHYKLLPTYTGQADQLIALGISPDYYPYQLNQTKAYKYLTDPSLYMTEQAKVNPEFARKFDAKIKQLFGAIGEKGRSWWNMNAEKNDNSNPNPEYWTTKSGDLTLYEHYLLDDDKKIIDSAQTPSYDVALQTNFRWSQDPYTRLSKITINDAFDKKDTDDDMAKKIQQIFGMRDSNSVAIESQWTTTGSGNSIKTIGTPKPSSEWDTKNALFNDAWFAYSWHMGFMDNPILKAANGSNQEGMAHNFEKFLVNLDGNDTKQIFGDGAGPVTGMSDNAEVDKKLAHLFAKGTLPKEIRDAGLTQINYKDEDGVDAPAPAHSRKRHGHIRNDNRKRHHPIYDAQAEVGEAPMFEGARRENMLYLYNLASQLTHTVKGENAWGQDQSTLNTQAAKDINLNARTLKKDFAGDPRLGKMENALKNANTIAGNLDVRLTAIAKYFETIQAKGKVVALTTIAPGGGVSTIQTNSKYSFLFDRLGLKYPMPKNFKTMTAVNPEGGKASVFSMDDNGWFWNIGDKGGDLAVAKTEFEGTADYQILTVREKEWEGSTGTAKSNLASILKDDAVKATGTATDSERLAKLDKNRANYDLWNEGLKTPFVLNMILDDLIVRIEKGTKVSKVDGDQRKAALQWGDYWTTTFVA